MKRHVKTMSTPHSRLVDSITEKLVTAISGVSPNNRKFPTLCEAANTRFKANIDRHPDPHAIREHFTGLVEKFAILGREDIAEPLEKLLPYILSQDANVEILTMLFALSDRPVETMEFDESKFVMKEVEEKGITWEEILADEPLEGDHWNEPEYSGSDEDEELVYEKKSPIVQEAAMPTDEERTPFHPEKEPSKANDKFLQAQYWTRRQKFVVLNKAYDSELDVEDQYDDQYYLLTELDAIREILFMLSGWNCILFTVSNTSIKVNTDYRLDHASADALTSILSQFADYGSSVHSCRLFSKTYSKTATIQAFSAALSSQLYVLNSKLADLQSTYANLNCQATSLIALQNILHDDLELFYQIKSLVTKSYTSSGLLSRLHDLACQSNAIGSQSLHKFIKDLFMPSLETYLRPLHAWMTHGDLDSSSYPEFFISSSLENGHPAFDLVKDNGGVMAPKFMLHIVNRVLAAGKTMDFVKRMHKVRETRDDEFTSFLQLEIGECGSMNPFEQAFENALDMWISKKYDYASQMLRETLHDKSELWRTLDGIHGTYCMLAYPSMTKFTQTLFQKMDQSGEWRDRHVLTDDLHEAFTPDISSSLISVRCQRSCSLTAPLKCLEALKIIYKTSWPISDVLRTHSNGVYQQILTFLLQIRRTKYLLDRACKVAQQRERRGLKKDVYIVHVVRLELVWFVNTLLNYLGIMVIEPTLREMREKLQESRDVEELAYIHIQYTSSLQYQCLLNDKLSTIYNSIMDILGLGVSFVDKYLQCKGEVLSTKKERRQHTRTTSLSDDEEPEVVVQESVSEEQFVDFVKYLDDRFLRAIPFIRSGLKGTARAAEFPSLGILSSALEAGVR